MYSGFDLFKLQKYRGTLKISLESKKECGIWERFNFVRNLRSAINNRLHCRSFFKTIKKPINDSQFDDKNHSPPPIYASLSNNSV